MVAEEGSTTSSYVTVNQERVCSVYVWCCVLEGEPPGDARAGHEAGMQGSGQRSQIGVEGRDGRLMCGIFNTQN